MFNSIERGERTFKARLLKAQASPGYEREVFTPDLQQWLEYWNDAESVTSNMRKFEHWLERAKLQKT